MVPHLGRPRVAVVAHNHDTLDELGRYLREHGMDADVLPIAASELLSGGHSAIVLFPDDFESALVARFVANVRASQPSVLLVLVTRTAHHALRLGAAVARSTMPLVLPRPPFGWTIVDAIRQHVSLARAQEA